MGDNTSETTGLAASKLIAAAQATRPGAPFEKHDIGPFDPDAVQAATGHSLTRYSAIADSHSLQHIMKWHGTAAEAKRGQKPIEAMDFGKLSEILRHPDDIIPLGQTRIGRDVLGFVKAINGWKFKAVMEVRTGKKELALTSLYTIGKTKE